ncbi:hypothetical protein WMY93_026260 [Mugilogobius chulae]|uniref:Uncharacterized protein n=1 Tax=Mugilogobius chulae TaxID=88201 RepID=A0AAW0N0E5_9GOBI
MAGSVLRAGAGLGPAVVLPQRSHQESGGSPGGAVRARGQSLLQSRPSLHVHGPVQRRRGLQTPSERRTRAGSVDDTATTLLQETLGLHQQGAESRRTTENSPHITGASAQTRASVRGRGFVAFQNSLVSELFGPVPQSVPPKPPPKPQPEPPAEPSLEPDPPQDRAPKPSVEPGGVIQANHSPTHRPGSDLSYHQTQGRTRADSPSCSKPLSEKQQRNSTAPPVSNSRTTRAPAQSTEGADVSDEATDTEDNEEEELGVLDEQRSIIIHLLSQLKLGMDLTRVVLPTFILEKRSLLEMYANFLSHPDMFLSITAGCSPEERMVRVLEYYLTSFHEGRKGAVAKKPYNPSWARPSTAPGAFPGTECDPCGSHPPWGRAPGGVAGRQTVTACALWPSRSLTSARVWVLLRVSGEAHVCQRSRLDQEQVHGRVSGRVHGRRRGAVPTGARGAVCLHVALCVRPLHPHRALGGARGESVHQLRPKRLQRFGHVPHQTLLRRKSPQSDCRGEAEPHGGDRVPGSGRVERSAGIHLQQRRNQNHRHAQTSSDQEEAAGRGQAEPPRVPAPVATRDGGSEAGNMEEATEHKHRLEEKQRNDERQRAATKTPWTPKHFTKQGDGWVYNRPLWETH